MAKKPKNPVQSPESAGGTGGQGTPATPNLDPSDRKDRKLIMQAVRERWPMTAAIREAVVKTTAAAMEMAHEAGEPREVAGCARVLAAIEKQNQDDEHLIDKNDRIDQGKATESYLLIDDMGEKAEEKANG